MNTIDRHDESTLWAYAARELGDGENQLVEDHLDDCPDCRERLASVQIAREALEGARQALPFVCWQPLDDTVGRLVEKRLAAQARRPYFLRLGLGLTALAAAGLLAFFAPGRGEPAPAAPVAGVEAAAPPAPVTARVDRASGLERSGARDVPDGTVLLPGDQLKTIKSGRAFLHLPDLSHVRLAGGSSLTLSRLSVDDVAMNLEQGRVAVRASHQDRKGFTIFSGGLTVHVVGTIFSVSQSSDGTEVAVAEGRVRVELPNDDEEFVNAGQRLRLDPRGRLTRNLKLTAALSRELDEVTTVGDAATAVETNAVVSASGGRPSQPPLLSAQGTPRTLPRLSAKEARARQVELPAEARAGSTPGLSLDELAQPPASSPEEWSTGRTSAPEPAGRKTGRSAAAEPEAPAWNGGRSPAEAGGWNGERTSQSTPEAGGSNTPRASPSAPEAGAWDTGRASPSAPEAAASSTGRSSPSAPEAGAWNTGRSSPSAREAGAWNPGRSSSASSLEARSTGRQAPDGTGGNGRPASTVDGSGSSGGRAAGAPEPPAWSPRASRSTLGAQRDGPVTQRLEPKTELEVEGPAEPPPLAQRLGHKPAPAHDEAAEWVSLPAPSPMLAVASPGRPEEARPVAAPPARLEDARPAAGAKLRDDREGALPAPARPLARDLESIFMGHAEAALEQGTCERFLVGLEDIAQDAAKNARTELARVLRARCFNLQLRPRQSLNEYRKYLEEYPRGRYAPEAAEAIGP
jgi:hypothetical protein